jgi:DNA repair exonuclease SbcCD ATPase subunit
MKNSLSTNLLILDETFDSSLDNDGIENLMNLIRTFKENTNIFVISHKAEVRDRFDQTLVFRKENNFSTYDII